MLNLSTRALWRAAAGSVLAFALATATQGGTREAKLPDINEALHDDVLDSARLGPVPGGFASWRALFAEQVRLNAAAERLQADPASVDRLASIVADPTARALVVYWKGEVSTHTQQLLTSIRNDVPVDVRAARFSAAELRALADHLARQSGVVHAHGRVDGSGVEMLVEDGPAHRREALAHRLLQQHALSPWSSIPLSHSFGPQAIPAASRETDRPPYTGGARVYLGNACTLGFSAVSPMHGRGFISAAHCGGVGSTVYEDSGDLSFDVRFLSGKPGRELGTVVQADKTIDLNFIRPLSGRDVLPRVYTGRPTGDDPVIPIRGWAANAVGNFVFTSGSTSGLNGPIQIEALRVSHSSGIKFLHKARHWYGMNAVAPGDSGGPVIAFHPDGRAEARGIISQHSTKAEDLATCSDGWRMFFTTDGACSAVVFFVDIIDGAKTLSADVLKGSW